MTCFLVWMMKKWTSPVYAFFEPVPTAIEVQGHHAHEFKCSGRSCKVTVRRFIDTKDAGSTGNMRRHVKTCWGEDALNTVDIAKDVNEARTKVVQGILRDGSITTAFEQKDKQSVRYSSRPYTQSEIR